METFNVESNAVRALRLLTVAPGGCPGCCRLAGMGLCLAVGRGVLFRLEVALVESGARWPRGRVARSVCYLLLWPGMDAQAFLTGPPPPAPLPREVFAALAKLGVGLTLIFAVSSQLIARYPLWAAWAGMAGIALTLLFGLRHLLSVAWRYGGINGRAIMNRPLAAHSLSDFWSNRWNLAFRDAGRLAVFQPLVARFGVAPATLAVFWCRASSTML